MGNTGLDASTELMKQPDSTSQILVAGNTLPVGTRLSEFELTELIGEGGFGAVYLAFDHSLQRIVAVKEYMPAALAGRTSDKSVIVHSEHHKETFETGLRSFINEARLLAQFDHPALIKVHRFWEQNNTAYMAMRYYEGKTLKAIIRNHPEMITEEWLKTMLSSILEALDALYKVNILHRDISPDNIMIQDNGCAVLLDFGAARQIIGDMTQALTVILKPGFAPVEQYADDLSMKQGAWTDIYALSAVLYSAITRKPPPASVARMIKDPLEPLTKEKYPAFSEVFLSAINAGLRVNPEQRPQSIDAFRQSLYMEQVQVAAPKKAIPPPVDPFAATIVVPRQTVKVEDPTSVPTMLIPPKQGKNANSVEKATATATTPWPQKEPTIPKPTAQKSNTGLRIALLIGLIVVVGLGTVGGFFYFNRDKALSIGKSGSDTAQTAQTAQSKQEDDETEAWNAATANPANLKSGLTNFINKYPSGKYTAAAQAKLAELGLQETMPSVIPPAVVNPVTAASAPTSNGSDASTRKADEENAWNALKDETLATNPSLKANLEDFINKYPSGKYTFEAGKKLAYLLPKQAEVKKNVEKRHNNAANRSVNDISQDVRNIGRDIALP